LVKRPPAERFEIRRVLGEASNAAGERGPQDVGKIT